MHYTPNSTTGMANSIIFLIHFKIGYSFWLVFRDPKQFDCNGSRLRNGDPASLDEAEIR